MHAEFEEMHGGVALLASEEDGRDFAVLAVVAVGWVAIAVEAFLGGVGPQVVLGEGMVGADEEEGGIERGWRCLRSCC